MGKAEICKRLYLVSQSCKHLVYGQQFPKSCNQYHATFGNCCPYTGVNILVTGLVKTGKPLANFTVMSICRAGSSANNLALLNFEYLSS